MRAAMGLKKRPSAEMPKTIAKSKPVFPQTKPFEPFLEPYRPPVSKPVAKHNQEPIDRKTRRQIAKGSVPINDRLDLHGMTQDEAYGALIGFVSRARSAGHRHVLVITGKGLSKQGQGVLRRMVPRWLKAAPLAQHVNGFEWASPGHGGDGALYIRLRRSLDGANGKAYRP
jgi:DNA-nicking Smr family endonuclease